MILERFDYDELDDLISQSHWTEESSPQWKYMRAQEHELEVELFRKRCREMGIPNRNDPENKWAKDTVKY